MFEDIVENNIKYPDKFKEFYRKLQECGYLYGVAIISRDYNVPSSEVHRWIDYLLKCDLITLNKDTTMIYIYKKG